MKKITLLTLCLQRWVLSHYLLRIKDIPKKDEGMQEDGIDDGQHEKCTARCWR
jgi:hypothetical protein